MVDLSNDECFFRNGRVELLFDKRLGFLWAGSSVTFYFSGASIELKLSKELDKSLDCCFDIYVDGEVCKKVTLSSGKSEVISLNNLNNSKHKFEIVRRCDFWSGVTTLDYVKISENGILYKHNIKKRYKFEFYGASETSGQHIEIPEGLADEKDTVANNNGNLSFGALVAKKFNGEFRLISAAGLGLITGWHDGRNFTLNDIYEREVGVDSKNDFSKWQADFVVVLLGTNDSYLLEVGKDTDVEEIENSYIDFAKKIRSKYANAEILFMLGPLKVKEEWKEALKNSVIKINKNDKKVYYLLNKEDANELGHPRIEAHKKVALNICNFLETKIHNINKI